MPESTSKTHPLTTKKADDHTSSTIGSEPNLIVRILGQAKRSPRFLHLGVYPAAGSSRNALPAIPNTRA
jgi:hypothetical protein